MPPCAPLPPTRVLVYGAGMVGGALLLRLLRHKLSRLPLIGVVTRPILGEGPRALA